MKNWQGPAEMDTFDSAQVRIPDSIMEMLLLSGIPFEKASDVHTVLLNRETVQTWIHGLGHLLAASNECCTKNDSDASHTLNNMLSGAFFVLRTSEDIV